MIWLSFRGYSCKFARQKMLVYQVLDAHMKDSLSKSCTYIHFIYFFNYQTLTELEKDPLKFFLNTVRI